MCVSPNRIEELEVACRKCWQCRSQRVKDYVGRAFLEMLYNADAAFSVTLTYKGDCTNAVVLQYRDVQLFLKRLRNDGYKVRYMVAGEYGSLRGRAHWHIVLFFRGKVPQEVPEWFEEPSAQIGKTKEQPNQEQRALDQIKINTRIPVSWWGGAELPNAGFTYWQKPDFAGLYYVMKYALKNQDTREKRWSVSKEPLLGYGGLVAMAEEYVRTGTIPNATYRVPELRDKDGRLMQFKMTGKSKEVFFETFLDRWRQKFGTWPPVEPETVLANWFQKRFNTELKQQVDIINPEDRELRERLLARRQRREKAENDLKVGYIEARAARLQKEAERNYAIERARYEFAESEEAEERFLQEIVEKARKRYQLAKDYREAFGSFGGTVDCEEQDLELELYRQLEERGRAFRQDTFGGQVPRRSGAGQGEGADGGGARS